MFGVVKASHFTRNCFLFKYIFKRLVNSPAQVSELTEYPTRPSTTLETQNPWIDELYVVQARCTTDFKASK